MTSKFSNVLMLLCAVLAFAPILAVDYLLDGYIRSREAQSLQSTVESVAERMQSGANDAVASLRRILSDSPSLCTPTFIANVHKQMESSLFLRQVLVENSDGVQYCDAFGKQVKYSPLSETLSVPGHTETITVVKLADLDTPVLKITQSFGKTRQVSAFVPLLAQGLPALSAGMPAGTMTRVLLTNGTTVMSVGDTGAFDRAGQEVEFVHAAGNAGELPLKAEAAVPFSVVRANYADLDFGFTIIAAIMSASVLLLALNFVRRSKLPAFDLERAISAGEIKPYYQPVINLRTGKIAGCEVLCRWEKRNGKVIMPGAFIDYAEVTGLAIPMTLSLMQQVKHDLSGICREMPSLKISINLFEGHFRDGGIVDDVQAIFGKSPIEYTSLVFEITERRPIANSTETHAVIAGLHKLGARLAIDDVGTGHSNLSYMQTLGVDVIKIDRMFIDQIKDGKSPVPVLEGLIAMANGMGLELVAEGVETEQQAIFLRNRGINAAQGFLFAPALKAAAFCDLARALNTDLKSLPHSAGPSILRTAA